MTSTSTSTSTQASQPAAIPAAREASSSSGRIRALVAAHRHAQAEQRAALAAETDRALSAADHRARAVIDALHRGNSEEMAALLTREAQAGTALVVALTSDDATPEEIESSLSNYRQRRAAVDSCPCILGNPVK